MYGMTLAMLLGVAPAVEPDAYAGKVLLDHGWPAHASAAAGAALVRDPSDLSAHLLWLDVHDAEQRGHEVTVQLASWHALAPHDPLRRTVYALALSRLDSPDCDQLYRLLTPMPEDPQLRAFAALAMHRAHLGACDGSAVAAAAMLHAMSDEVSVAATSRFVTESAGMTPEHTSALDALLARHPVALRELAVLWSDAAGGPALEVVQRRALTHARRYARSSEPALVLAAQEVFDAAGRPARSARALTRAERWLSKLGDPTPVSRRVVSDALFAHPASPPPTAIDVSVPPHPLVGHAFPELEVMVDGEPMALRGLAGPLVVDVWATWCSPCTSGLKTLGSLRDHGELEVVALSVDTDTEAWADFVRDRPAVGFTYAWVDPDVAWKALRLRGVPVQFVLDRHLRIAHVVEGWRPGDPRLERAVVDALGR